MRRAVRPEQAETAVVSTDWLLFQRAANLSAGFPECRPRPVRQADGVSRSGGSPEAGASVGRAAGGCGGEAALTPPVLRKAACRTAGRLEPEAVPRERRTRGIPAGAARDTARGGAGSPSCDGEGRDGSRPGAGHPAHCMAGSRHAPCGDAGGPTGRLPGSTVHLDLKLIGSGAELRSTP